MIDWSTVDYSSAPRGYRELRTSVVRVDLPLLHLFLLTGTDSMSWLQGQCTNDVSSLNERHMLDFCLTKPTGQILALCRAWTCEGGLVVATEVAEALLARIEETVIMEDVSMSHLQKKTCIQGPRSRSIASTSFLPFDWTGSSGSLVEPEVGDGLPAISEEAWNLATLECGHPIRGIDYTEKTLPPELGPAFDAQFVSYKKGCYTGQEVLMRIKSRGHTNKTWVALKSDVPIQAGNKVYSEGREVGVTHRAAHSPVFGHIASATVKNSVAHDGTVVEVGSGTARVAHHPLITRPSS